MAKYQIAKLDVNSVSHFVYEKRESFGTAAEMFSRITAMIDGDNGWFYGRGSVIIRDDEVIATLHNYECAMMPVQDQFTGRMITPRPSIKRLMEYVAETQGG